MTRSTHPSKNVFKKSQKKFHEKAVQSNILWLNLNKITEISILQSAHKQANPSFHFHAPGSKRRYRCTQTVTPLRVPTIPVATGFCESRLKYTFSCHGKLSTIVETKKSASNITVITVASFYPLNSVWLQYSGLKYYLHNVHSLRGSHESILNR